MDYFNPFMRNIPMAPAQTMPVQRQSQPQIDPQQFRQFAITLNDNALANFAQLARQQGISETDIQNGIRFIKSL
jgi:hypothetical protein